MRRSLRLFQRLERLEANVNDHVRTGILLMNLGGPTNSTEVQPFLLRLFSDRDLIPLPFQSLTAKWIATRRAPRIIEQYNQIGGGSPIKYWTSLQGVALQKLMDKASPESAPHKSYIAFRYAPPLTADTIKEILADKVQRVVVFTQYPQYSCSTTGSSLNELYRCAQKWDPKGQISWKVIDRWPTSRGLVKVFAEHIRKELDKFPSNVRGEVVILFSAHSLPMTVVNRGDSYPLEVGNTVHAVMNYLQFSHEYRLVWQSQVGPQPWLGPQTNDSLKGLGKLGKKHVLLVPIAFTSDHIETLFELDIEYGKHGKEYGLENLRRAESLNGDPEFIEAMKDEVLDKLLASNTDDKGKTLQPISKQFLSRCPKCMNDTCQKMRDFFKNQPQW